MKKLLITGGSGLLGQALLAKLPPQTYEVFAVTTDVTKFPRFEGVTPIQADLLNESSRHSLIEHLHPDILVHLAWDLSPEFKQSDANLAWLAASLDLLHEFHRQGGRRFIFAGSGAEYDGERGNFSENTGSAQTQYGICKRAFGETAMRYGEKFGLEIAVPRYFTIYGENDRHFDGTIPSAIIAFLRGERFLCNMPYAIRDFIYSEDAAEVTVKLLESHLTGAINITSGNPSSMRDIFSTIAEEMGTKHLLEFSKVDAPPDILTADISRMKNELGYTCKVNLKNGLNITIDWWKKSLEL